jgi:hypothetical protein
MKREISLFALGVLAAALPAFAAPTCNAGQTVVGNNCVLTAALGWITAGNGTDAIFGIYVPPNVSGPVDIEITGLSSNLGDAYKGYFGFVGTQVGDNQSQQYTLADLVAGTPASIGSVSGGSGFQFQIIKVCWDPTCTSPAPAGAVPNMMSMQLTLASPTTADLNTNYIQLTVRFLNGTQVSFEEQEFGLHTNSQVDIVPGVSIGATPASRYVYNNGTLTQPFEVLSVSNFANPNSLGATVTLKDYNGGVIISAPMPSVPPNGAAGFLVIGEAGNSTAALFPSSTVLPAGPDGNFHGVLEVQTTGQVLNGLVAVLAQEFNGNTMLNMPVFHSPIP